jgi:hypothetical protein
MSAENPEVQVIKPISITPKEYAQSFEFAPLNEPLGAIVMAFAQLEATLTMSINDLLGIDYKLGIALDDLIQGTITRIKLFHTLAILKTTGLFVEKVKALRTRLLKSNDFRNNYIHGQWTGIRPDGSFIKVRYKADRGLHPVSQTIAVSVDALWDAHKYIFVTALELAQWRHAYNFRRKPELWPTSWHKEP